MTDAHAEELRELLLQAVRTNDATVLSQDRYGVRYQLDFALTRAGRQSIIRSHWRPNVSTPVRLLDVVALTEDLGGTALKRGQVGTVVELLEPDAVEVEFSDDNGRAYATAAVPASKLIILRYRPELAA